MSFPYAFIIRDVGVEKEDYETTIQLLATKEDLKTVKGIYRGREELAIGIYLLKIEGNLNEAGEREDLKVLLYGNKVMVFSEHMTHVVSHEKRMLSIVDRGRPTVIEY